jgi:D-sedoheptulose 7-phosphate isomerase
MNMLGATLKSHEYLQAVQREVGRLNPDELDGLAAAIFDRYRTGRFVYIIGNGGSGANASHMCEDLGKGTAPADDNARRLKVLSLSDNTSYILAWGNDASFDRIFVEQLRNLGEPGDLLIAISGSGNSPNILRAVEWANAQGLETWGMTGFCGGKLRRLAKHCVHSPSTDMGVIESMHVVAFHYVFGRVYAMVQGHVGHARAA